MLAQLVLPGGSVLPLWSKLKSVSPSGIELVGKNNYMDWSISVRADAASRGVGIDLRIIGKKRLPDVRIELLSFQTILGMSDVGGAVLLNAREETRLKWDTKNPQLKFIVADDSGLAALRSEPFVLTPSLLRLSAHISPAERALSRR
jgi:hypothetical protein